MNPKVAVFFGGKSVEHEVSIISAIQAIQNIDTDKYDVLPVYVSKAGDMYVGESIGDIDAYKDIDGLLNKSTRVILLSDDDRAMLVPFRKGVFSRNKSIAIDIAFPIVHGTNMEDGAFQGYLRSVGLPFVGCEVLSSAVGMDKYIMKAILKEHDIPVLDALQFTLSDYEDVDKIVAKSVEKIGYPMIVKPVNLGSSVGITVATDEQELIDAIDTAFKYASKILVEHAITNLREINCSVLGDCNNAEASECEEPLHGDKLLSYEDKYLNNAKGGKSSGMASVSRVIPAEISDEMRTKIRKLAVDSFKALDCNGVSRIDFMIDGDTDEVYFNEINTIPGSLAFYLWEPIGVEYKELLSRMIDLALQRHREQNNITYSFDTNILDVSSLSGSKGSKGSKV